VVVVSGHATAAGAMLLLAADVRIGVRGEGRIGLSEVRFGLEVPPLTRQLVRDRLAGPAQYPATALARLHAPEDALKAGFLDRLAETPEAAETLAQEAEAELAALDEPAYLATKLGMRTAFAELMQREGG
jgi:enoyl-CoA hydratase